MKRLLLVATAALAFAASSALAQSRGPTSGAGSDVVAGQDGGHPGSSRSGGHGFGTTGHGGPGSTLWGHGHNNQYNTINRNYVSRHRYQNGDYRRPHGWYWHHWSYGEFLPALFFATDYWINNWRYFALDAPPPGCVWIRYGNDALLIDEDTGEVIQVAYEVFY